MERSVPDEGDLVLIHPGLQLQTGIFSKRGDDETEDKSDADEHGRENNLESKRLKCQRGNESAGDPRNVE